MTSPLFLRLCVMISLLTSSVTIPGAVFPISCRSTIAPYLSEFGAIPPRSVSFSAACSIGAQCTMCVLYIPYDNGAGLPFFTPAAKTMLFPLSFSPLSILWKRCLISMVKKHTLTEFPAGIVSFFLPRNVLCLYFLTCTAANLDPARSISFLRMAFWVPTFPCSSPGMRISLSRILLSAFFSSGTTSPTLAAVMEAKTAAIASPVSLMDNWVSPPLWFSQSWFMAKT